MSYEVLIIDDDQIICMLINKIIQKSNLPSASIFNKANDALQHILSYNTKEHHFLIFLDINMPVMNGWDFLNNINSNNVKANVYIAMITSSINESDKKMADQFDCVFEFLNKPVKQESIEQFSKKIFLKPFF